ncbi:MAG: hypothetical protein ACJ77E_00535 [Gaiellaceae bacterium]
MPAAGIVMIVAVVLIVVALVYFLVATILALRQITAALDDVIASVTEVVQKTRPVNDVVTSINEQLDAGVDLLEGLLVKKAGLVDALGLVDGLYAGAASTGFRHLPDSTTLAAPRIGEVYTKGTLTLARLGRNAPIALASPAGPAVRDAAYASGSARKLYPGGRPDAADRLPRSPTIGGDAPVQYEQREDVGAPRKRLPSRS